MRVFLSFCRCPCSVAVATITLLLGGAVGATGQTPPGLPPLPLPDGPRVFETAEHPQVRLVVVTRGLSHPVRTHQLLPNRLEHTTQILGLT